MTVNVDFVPEAEGCSDVNASETSCTAIITKDDMYTVTLTLSNDAGQSEPAMMEFDCEHIHAQCHDYLWHDKPCSYPARLCKSIKGHVV